MRDASKMIEMEKRIQLLKKLVECRKERDELKRKVKDLEAGHVAIQTGELPRRNPSLPTVEEIEASGVMLLQFFSPELGEEFNEEPSEPTKES